MQDTKDNWGIIIIIIIIILKDYIKKQQRLIAVTRNSTGSIKINRTTITGKQKWEEK